MFSSWREFEVAYALYSCVPRRDFLDAWIEVISKVEGAEKSLDTALSACATSTDVREKFWISPRRSSNRGGKDPSR